MTLRLIPFGEYKPDVPRYKSMASNDGSSQTVVNVVPKSKEGAAVTYGPMYSMAPYTNALTARCQGAFALFSTLGNVYTFAGDASKLYVLTSASTNWSTAKTGLATATDDWYSFTSYGDQVIATNGHDPLQTFTLDSSTNFSDLITGGTGPTTAKYVTLVKNFLFCGYTTDTTDGTRPQRIWWSGEGTPGTFPAVGSDAAMAAQSDYQDVVGEHGRLSGLVSSVARQDCVAIFERGVYNINYVGPPSIFSFTPVSAKGTYAPKSIVKENNMVFWYSEDGFRVYDGSVSRPIGQNRVDDKIRRELDAASIDRIVGVSDPTNKCIYWAYPSSTAINQVPDQLLIYNFEYDSWSSAQFNVEFLFRAITYGKNLEQLGVLYSNLDSLPFSLDAAIWATNNLTVAGFGSDHKMNLLSGAPLTPSIETMAFMVGDGQQMDTDTRGVIHMTRPVYEGIYYAPTISIGHRETLAQDYTYGSAVALDQYGQCPQRVSGRYFTARLSEGTTGYFERLVGVEVNMKTAGRR